ncbi:MAG: Ig-like domain-containing protein [Bacteroidetes bacterium]|nr:hypothetical protein [Bacteroidota bacterium]MBV6460307.1 hypothetical protein [Flavobacteriales bacterium]WKZ74675.1 MAG: Ig-like domain-containing protein [Vicingaceae bacterium]MCL4815827.1 Ig-like domain-containing protein [Flavobacteriales bacterium]NOG94982.1 Ig-like domain-containing protein [Bacteroidota bacterium]
MKKRIPYLVVLGIFFSCAQVSSPTGGPRDETPPRDSVCSPKNNSTSFNEKEIEIRFTEYINLKELSTQLIISPFSKILPEVTVKGKTLRIIIKDTLQENTTYVYHFGKSIVDITEGNAAENFNYVFSTGNTIDTSKISGKVLNSFTFQPEEDFMVMLYTSHNDSAPLTLLPNYIAKTNKEGNFLFTNLKMDRYKIFAIKDNNRNYLFDLPDEIIAYNTNPIAPDTHITLLSFKEDSEKQFVKKSSELQSGKFGIFLNKPSEKIEVKSLDANDLMKENYPSSDTIIYWLKNKPLTEKLRFVITDSDSIIDTVAIRVSNFEKTSKEKTSLSYNLQNANLNLGENIKVTFSRPIETLNDSLLKLYCDSTPIPFKLNFDGFRKLVLEANWEENKNYSLHFLPSFFADVYAYKNDSLTIKFKTHEKKFYGSLQLKIKSNKNQSYIFQLLNEKEEVQKQEVFIQTSAFNYAQIIPGKYKLRVIEDANQNGKWDTGKYIKNIQPEKVIVYTGTLNIRSNWEQEIEWLLEE